MTPGDWAHKAEIHLNTKALIDQNRITLNECNSMYACLYMSRHTLFVFICMSLCLPVMEVEIFEREKINKD